MSKPAMTFKGLCDLHDKYMQDSHIMAELESMHVDQIQWGETSFGEALFELLESNNKMMKRDDLTVIFKLSQGIYYYHVMLQHYEMFFEQADVELEGKLSELFLNGELLSKRIMQ
ncbi:hypothetical protein N9937_00340 [bacterium]|nr:hypothetical protein [bacterium]